MMTQLKAVPKFVVVLELMLFVVCVACELYLNLLEAQSCFGDKPVKFQVVCPQNGASVLKGLNRYSAI